MVWERTSLPGLHPFPAQDVHLEQFHDSSFPFLQSNGFLPSFTMMSYGMRSRQFFSSFSVFRNDSDSEHSEFEEFTQKKLKPVTCFCLYIINISLHPRVGSTHRPKQKPKSPPCRRRPTINLTRSKSSFIIPIMNPSGGHIFPSTASLGRLKKLKHQATQTEETGVSKKDRHGTNASIADRNIAEQENVSDIFPWLTCQDIFSSNVPSRPTPCNFPACFPSLASLFQRFLRPSAESCSHFLSS